MLKNNCRFHHIQDWVTEFVGPVQREKVRFCPEAMAVSGALIQDRGPPEHPWPGVGVLWPQAPKVWPESTALFQLSSHRQNQT